MTPHAAQTMGTKSKKTKKREERNHHENEAGDTIEIKHDSLCDQSKLQVIKAYIG